MRQSFAFNPAKAFDAANSIALLKGVHDRIVANAEQAGISLTDCFSGKDEYLQFIIATTIQNAAVTLGVTLAEAYVFVMGQIPYQSLLENLDAE